MNFKIVIIVLAGIIVLTAFYLQKNYFGDYVYEQTQEAAESEKEMYIMPDGKVALRDGSVVEDAVVTESGKIILPDGTIKNPIMNLKGLHIMPDGSVMLGDGTVLNDAVVMEDGKVKLSNGIIVTPIMDMRKGGSMEDMENMMNMKHNME